MKANSVTIEYDKNLPARIRFRDGPSGRCRGEPHRHKEPELIYVDSGSLTVELAGKSVRLERGGVFAVNSNEVHSLCGSAEYLTVHLSYGFLMRYNPSLDYSSIAFERGSREEHETALLLQKLLAIERGGGSFSPLKAYSVLMKLVRHLLSRCVVQKRFSLYSGGKTPAADAEAVRSYIGAHYREKLTLGDIARLLGRRQENISPYFKQLTGACFRDYLNAVRAQNAVDDLTALDISVRDAALRNGFGNMNSFANACKSIYGATPLQLKKRRRAELLKPGLGKSA